MKPIQSDPRYYLGETRAVLGGSIFGSVTVRGLGPAQRVRL